MLNGNQTRLRLLEETDLHLYAAWISDPQLAKTVLGDAVSSSKDVTANLWQKKSPEHDLLFIIETFSGEPIGCCFLRNIHPMHRFAELEQFFIGKFKNRRHGHGEDAITTLIRHCFGDLDLNRIWLITYAYNIPAILFYKKYGFRKEGVLRKIQCSEGMYHDGIMMALLRQDWISSPKRLTSMNQQRIEALH